MVSLPKPSGKELMQFLVKQGFELKRIRGSHHFLERNDQRTCIPVHGNKTLKVGTLRSILRDINMSASEFIEEWNR